jgi:hypothetical protein
LIVDKNLNAFVCRHRECARPGAAGRYFRSRGLPLPAIAEFQRSENGDDGNQPDQGGGLPERTARDKRRLRKRRTRPHLRLRWTRHSVFIHRGVCVFGKHRLLRNHFEQERLGSLHLRVDGQNRANAGFGSCVEAAVTKPSRIVIQAPGAFELAFEVGLHPRLDDLSFFVLRIDLQHCPGQGDTLLPSPFLKRLPRHEGELRQGHIDGSFGRWIRGRSNRKLNRFF